MSLLDKAKDWYGREYQIEIGVTFTRERKSIYEKDESAILDLTQWPIKVERSCDDEQSRKSDNQGSLWNSRPSNQTHLRSNEERTKGRTSPLGRKV